MEHTILEKFKTEVHRTLISKLDLEKLSRVNSTQARQAVAAMVTEILSDQRVPLNFRQRGAAESSQALAPPTPRRRFRRRERHLFPLSSILAYLFVT